MQDKEKYLIIGLIIVVALFLFIEYNWNYNFTKDDNLVQFLPSLLHGEEQIFSGHFPSLNNNQYLGTKLFEVGTYALFYPPMILAYILSHYVFQNDYLLLEIFAFLHLILGFIVTYYFICYKTYNPLVSLIAGLSWIFSGYALIAGANWYYVFPTLIFLPLLLWLNDKFREFGNIRIIFLSGILKGIYFYSGNAQYFFYALIFEFLYGFYNQYQSKDKILIYLERYFLSTFVCLIIAFPLLFAQYNVANTSERGDVSLIGYLFSLPSNPIELISGSILPYPLVESSNTFSYSPSSFSQIYYSGTIWAILFIIGWIYGVRKYNWKVFVNLPASYLLAILSIWLSIGIYGILYELGAFFPVISNFSSPFKLTLFTNFFIIFSGALLLSKIIIKYHNRESYKIIRNLLLIIFGTLLIYHVYVSSNVAWSYYGDKLPLNQHPLNEFYNNESGRVISLFSNSSLDPRQIKYFNQGNDLLHSPFLTQSFASYYDIEHISGYEPFVDILTSSKIQIERFGLHDVNINLTTIKEYGVKYIISPSSDKLYSELNNLPIIYQDDILKIIEIRDSKGKIFSNYGEIEYSQEYSHIKFKTNFTTNSVVTINYLYKPEYRIKSNVELTIEYDELGRMQIIVPAGYHELEVYYLPVNLIKGLIVSIILLLILISYIKFRENILYYISKLDLKLSKKIVIIITLIIFIALCFIIFDKLTSPELISEVIKERTNLDFNLSKIQINLLNMNIEFFDLSVITPIGNMAKAEKMKIKLSFVESIYQTIENKRLSLILDDIQINKIEVIDNNEENNICNNPLEIYGNENLLYNEKYKIDIEKINAKIMFFPLNEAEIEFNGLGLIEGANIEIIGKINVEKYVSGKIELKESKEIELTKKESCIILPRKNKNDIFN